MTLLMSGPAGWPTSGFPPLPPPPPPILLLLLLPLLAALGSPSRDQVGRSSRGWFKRMSSEAVFGTMASTLARPVVSAIVDLGRSRPPLLGPIPGLGQTSLSRACGGAGCGRRRKGERGRPSGPLEENLLRRNRVSRFLSSKMSTQSTQVFVSNLPSGSVDEAALRGIFEAIGQVVDVKVPKDRDSGLARGFAFITYSSAAEATAALEQLEGVSFGGKKVSVKAVKARGGPGGRSGGQGQQGGQQGWGGGWAGPGGSRSSGSSAGGARRGGPGGPSAGGSRAAAAAAAAPAPTESSSVLSYAAATAAVASDGAGSCGQEESKIAGDGRSTAAAAVAAAAPGAPIERASDFYSRLAGGADSLMADFGAFDPSSFESSVRDAKRAHAARNKERGAEASAAKKKSGAGKR